MKKHIKYERDSQSLYNKSSKKRIKDGFAYGVIGLSTFITVGILLFIIGFIFVTGAPKINLHFLTSAFDDMIDYAKVVPLEEYESNKLDVTLKVVIHDGHHYLAIDEIGDKSPLKEAQKQVVKGEGEQARLITKDFKIKKDYIIEEIGTVKLTEETIEIVKHEIKGLSTYLEQNIIIEDAKKRLLEINEESKQAKDFIELADSRITADDSSDINALETSEKADVEQLLIEKDIAEKVIQKNNDEYGQVMALKNKAMQAQLQIEEQFYEDNNQRIVDMAYKIINDIDKETLRIKIIQPGGGVVPMLVTTFYMIILSLLISGPIGVFAAIYLVEYAKPGPLIRVIRFGTESLAGIPSIIYGLFGALFFVTIMKLGISLISGALTVSIILLPVIIRQTEESLKAVPMSYREGSLGLGATKIQTIIKVVLPSAVPGILVAIILSVGRVVGESAAILLTAGTTARIPGSIKESGATLTIKAYQVAKEEGNIEMACAIGTVIIVLVVLINLSSKFISTRFMNMND